VTADALVTAFREEWPRILAAVIRFTGSPEIAEEAVQEAFARASGTRESELLINPAAWITTVAKRIAVDMVRKERRLRERLPSLAELGEQAEEQPLASPGGDDRLGLLFMVCAPELAPDVRLALALRFVCAVPTAEIADAMLVSHVAMSARLTRAKRQIQSDGVRLSPPDHFERGERLDDVLAVVHLLYTVGHTAPRGEQLGSRAVAETAIELARGLHRLWPEHAETAGLLALLLLTEARAEARVDDAGSVVSLEHADRSAWNTALIDEGLPLATRALRTPGRFALQAGIAGMHSQARTWEGTEWDSICLLYDRLVERWPSPAALLARIVARSFGSSGPAAALDELSGLERSLRGTSLPHAAAVRADLLRRSGRRSEAREAYTRAMDEEQNAAVRNFLEQRMGELGADPAG
jgi:RNA polymerase sigma-70 factor (ECF subfamily)